MTGINIPDMYQIVQEHGLIPVPLDLNINRMEPISKDALIELISPKVPILLTPIDQMYPLCLPLWDYL